MRVQCENGVTPYAVGMLNPRDMESFLAVVDAGSVSAAAEARFTSQPTVSRRIAVLEREVGAKLFRRTPTGMVPTTAGERLEPLARDLVKRARRATERMAVLANERQSFVVACPETTGNFFVAAFVAEGGAVSDIQPAAPIEVYARLRRGADIAVNTAPPPRGLRGMQLAQAHVHCQVPAGHPLAGRSSVELEEVVATPFLMPGSGSAVERVVSQAGEESGFALELGARTSNATLAQARAAAGQGAALAIEPPRFGLVAMPVRHRGRPLVVTIFAGWERSHYAHDELAQLAIELGAFVRQRLLEGGLGSVAAPVA